MSNHWRHTAFSCLRRRLGRSSASASNMPSLQETPRRDSFVFVRLGLALAVIFGHCFPLAPFGTEPVAAFCKNQFSPEGLAVKGFFILSGYLLVQSWTNQPSI